MPYDPAIHHRRSIRLPEFNYSNAGAYFVTICIHERRPLLSNIIDGKTHHTPAGEMVEAEWNALSDTIAGLTTDAFVVMPNHVHGIIWFNGGARPLASLPPSVRPPPPGPPADSPPP